MHRCQQCAKEKWNWRQCPGALDWFPPGVVRFCPNQIMWLLEHLTMLEDGRWPREPVETGYVDTDGSQRSYKNAHFETPICFAAEVTWRLSQTGKDGLVALQNLSGGIDELTLAELMGTTEDKIRHRVRRVIAYISGWRRRRITYYEFSRRKGISENYRKGG